MPTLKFLIVDDNPDGISLLSRALHRKFPRALILESVDADTAVQAAKSEAPSAVIIHRAGEHLGREIIAMVRQVNSTVPILAVSGYDRTAESVDAGATRFLNYDQWLLVGTVIEEMLARNSS